jgi:hypothetical protein
MFGIEEDGWWMVENERVGRMREWERTKSKPISQMAGVSRDQARSQARHKPLPGTYGHVLQGFIATSGVSTMYPLLDDLHGLSQEVMFCLLLDTIPSHV